MKDFEKEIKSYFDDEVSMKATPPFPMKKKGIKFDNILLAACVLGSLILITQPAIYESRIRSSQIPLSRIETFKEEFPRIIFEGFKYYGQNKGVEND